MPGGLHLGYLTETLRANGWLEAVRVSFPYFTSEEGDTWRD